jgi:KaiC/GvpD/RAD55 family RecA-like ATPase
VDFQSGIAPLDEHLGGLIPGRLHLLTGGPGTGKSTACYHFLQAGLRTGESVALLTLDRLGDLAAHATSIGFDLAGGLRDRKLGLLRYRPEFARYLASSASPFRAMDDLWQLIVDIQPTRLVIDPISPFLTDSTASGAAVAALAQLLDGFGVTTLLTYGGDLSAHYDARLNALIQRAAVIAHLAREQNGGLCMRVVQSRTRPAPANDIRFDLVPGTGLVARGETLTETVSLVGRIPGLVEITRLS